MKLKAFLLKISLFSLGTTSMLYAADGNPYTFGSGSTGSTESSSSIWSATPTSSTQVSSSAQTSQSTVTASQPVTTTTNISSTPAPQATTAQSPTNQYVTPTINPTPSTPKAVTFTQQNRQSNGTVALQPLTGTNSPLTAATTNGTTTLSTGGGNTQNLLQQILQQIQGVKSATGASAQNDASLFNYWTQIPSGDNFISTTSGYSYVSNLFNLETTAQNKKNAFTSVSFPNLSLTTGEGDSTNISYVNDLTRGIEGSNQYWIAAVNQALYNLVLQDTQMQSLQKAITAPFGGQANWISQLQTATTPQLLRAAVIEQAIQNELLYQSLQRQKDSELMQAAQLRLLADLQQTINQNSDSTNTQLRRLIQVLQQQNRK